MLVAALAPVVLPIGMAMAGAMAGIPRMPWTKSRGFTAGAGPG
ncbi:Uncharacterised protein [Mycobacterium tuberculosis]|nr:Uncharacterised protein [Mycobacterium tuberculosis]